MHEPSAQGKKLCARASVDEPHSMIVESHVVIIFPPTGGHGITQRQWCQTLCEPGDRYEKFYQKLLASKRLRMLALTMVD